MMYLTNEFVDPEGEEVTQELTVCEAISCEETPHLNGTLMIEVESSEQPYHGCIYLRPEDVEALVKSLESYLAERSDP